MSGLELHLTGAPPHPYIHNITLEEAIDSTLGVEDREDGLYISGKKYEEGWSFSFNEEAYKVVNKTLSDLPDPSIYDLLNITIAQGWEVVITTFPDTEPPVISWACYSEDRETISACVSDNLAVSEVSAHVQYGSNYLDIPLEDEDGDGIFTLTLPNAIKDTYDDYVTATDGKFVAISNDIPKLRDWWPMFHHDTSHTGSSLSNAPDYANVLWNYQTGGPVYYSSPAVADGKVFVGSYDNKIYCLLGGLSPPTATIGSISPDRAVAGEDTILFKGNGTDNGIVVAYQWESNRDGVINSSESFSMPASELSEGTHSIFFTVQDDQGLWSTQDVGYVTVKAPNAPPVVVFTISPDYPVINEAITFNASDSYDPGDDLDQFIKKYDWDFGDGVTATGKVVTHSYSEPGVYNVTLTVTDYYGLTNETTKTVSVYRVYTNEVGVTSTITVDSPANLSAVLPDEYNDTDISHAIVLNVDVTDSTPGNGTDDAYVDITTNVGDMDVETCQVFKAGVGFLPEVEDVSTLPTVKPPGEPAFMRDLDNHTVTIRLYVGDPLLGVLPPARSPWDINADGITNYLDAAFIGIHYGEVTTEPYPRYDINKDGVVNYLDAAFIGIHYGESTT